MRRWLLISLLSASCLAQTWSKWNGVTVGSSSGNISSMNGATIGTSTGNYGKWNTLNSPGGSSPVSFDVAAFKICSNGAGDCQIGGNFDLNLSVTVGSGSNRACIAAIGMSGGGSDVEPVPNIVTFGGAAMTNIASASVTGNYYQMMYYIVNPTSGSNNVRFEVTGLGVGASKMSIGVVCASNVNQSTPVNTGTTASDTGGGSSTTGTQTFTNGANDLGVAAMCQGTGISSGTGTQRWVDNNSVGACSSYAGYTIAGGTTSASYTFSGVDSWLFTVVSFKAA